MIGGVANAQTKVFNVENIEYYIQNKKIGLRYITSKKVVVPCKYDFIGSYSKNKMAPFKRNRMWGYLNDKGIEIIAPKFQEAKSFSSTEGLAPVKSNGKWGFINKLGIVKIPYKFDEVGGFSDGLSRVKVNGKWGMINASGGQVIPFKYDELDDFNKHGFASASINGKYGSIDKTGKTVIPFIYESSFGFNEDGYSVCKRDSKYGIVNLNGNESAKCIYDQSGSLANGLLCVQLNEKWGFIDYMGNMVIPAIYKYYMNFDNDIVGVDDTDGGSYILSKDTRRIASFPQCSFILRLNNYDEGTLFIVAENDRYGLVNKDGKYILPSNYKDIKIFHGCGLIGVKKTDKWGFVDPKGNLKIQYRFDDIGYYFQNNHIACKSGTKWGIIDTTGSTLVDFKYDIIDQNGMFSRTKLSDKWGAIGPDAKVVFEPKYDEVGYPTTTLRYYPVKLNGQDGYADYYGNDTF